MAPQIPGYFFDESKGKYFRVQPNHKATVSTSSAQYSRQNVQIHHQERVNKSKEQAARQRTQASRIDRINSTTIDLRIGISRSPARLMSNYFVCELESSSAHRGSLRELNSFAFSPAGELYIAGLAPLTFDVVRSTALSARASRITFTEPRTNNAPHSIAIVGENTLALAGGRRILLHQLSSTLSLNFTQSNYITSIATSPLQPTLLAICNGSLSLADTAVFTRSSIQRRKAPPQDPMAVAFSATDPNLVMLGARQGEVLFSDLRADEIVHRLQHSSGVMDMTSRTRAPNQLIVQGLSSTGLYDLRYCKPIPLPRDHRHHHDSDHQTSMQNVDFDFTRHTKAAKHKQSRTYDRRNPLETQPLVNFYTSTSHNSHFFLPGRSLAYLPSLDLAVTSTTTATSTQHPNNLLTIYDVSTGRILSPPKSYKGEIRGLLAQRTQPGNAESIFVLTPEKVDEWTVLNDHRSSSSSSTKPSLNEHPSRTGSRNTSTDTDEVEMDDEDQNERDTQRGGKEYIIGKTRFPDPFVSGLNQIWKD